MTEDEQMITDYAVENVQSALLALGFEIKGGRKKTPARVVKYWKEMLTPLDVEWTTFKPENTDEMIVIKDIYFYSACEHHLLPFHGKCHVAYLPKKKIVGLSKIPRMVKQQSRGFMTQEYLTNNIANELQRRLKCKGVGVVMEATHTCMSCRGAEAAGAETLTSKMLGVFKKAKTKQEFLNFIK